MEIYDWPKFKNSALHRDLIKKWTDMIGNQSLKEKDFHSFLFENPAIFLTDLDCYLCLSKIKLGSEYETDFVLVNEGYSDGTKYNLIEIETPNTELFDNSGKPTAKLNSALQQIRDWKRFLINNKSFVSKTFPSTTTRIVKDSNFKFTIVIGRRISNADILRKRKQICEENKVEIISFDRLTDYAKNGKVFFSEAAIHSEEMERVDLDKRNELANPFYVCATDAEWKNFTKIGQFHIFSSSINEILKHRKYNSTFEQFKNM